MKLVVLGILSALAVNASEFAIAYEGERLKQNIGQDYVECSVFYTIARELFRRNGDSTTEQQFGKFAEYAIAMGLTVFSQKEFEAKSELAMQILTKTYREESMSRLMLQYAQLCKNILENPVERMQYWKDMK